MSGIKFGTDGWRAVIGRDFTFDNLTTVTHATGRWILEEHVTSNGVVIGYDARFMGRQFAEHVAAVFAAMEIPVRMAASVTPTPAVSFAALHFDAVGVAITASHNPPEYSGFKIKAPFGGSASPDQIAEVERRLGASAGPEASEGSGEGAGSETGNDTGAGEGSSGDTGVGEAAGASPNASPINPKPFEEYCRSGMIRELDVTSLYLDDIRSKIDLEAIRESGIRIGHDSMFGAGAGLIARLLPGQVEELHGEFNPSFLGTPPEPIEKNLEEFAAFVPARGCAIGIANDGDADRIGVMDEEGRFVDSHKLLSLLVQYLYEGKGWKGRIVKTVSTTGMLDKQAAAYGLPLTVTPIGFKYVAELIVGGAGEGSGDAGSAGAGEGSSEGPHSMEVLVGGEESGGLAVKGHLPERDGIYIGLLLTEMLVKGGVPLSERVNALYEEFGMHVCYRDDMHTEEWRKQAMMARCRAGEIGEVCGVAVADRDMRDGVKHLLEDGSWVMVRPSGTEPVLRIYSEAADGERAQALVEELVAMVHSLEKG